MATWKTVRRTIRYAVVYALMRLMIVVSGIVPRKAWIRFCGRLGVVAYWFARQSRSLVHRNLSMVYARDLSKQEVTRMTREVFVMLGRNGGEVIRGFNIYSQETLARMRVLHGIEHVEAAHKKGKGVLLLTAHIGAFEFVATELATRGFQPMIVVTPLKDRRLNDLLLRQRNRFGALIVDRGKETVKLLRNLKAGGMVMILIDQDTRVKSRFVNFFGKPCATPIGATILAMRTGAAVVPMFIHLREDFLQGMTCYPEIPVVNSGDEEADLVTNTQRFSDAIEAEVRRHPTQWLWMHERWKTKPGEEIR